MVIVWSLRDGVRSGSERVGKLSLLVSFAGDCRRVESFVLNRCGSRVSLAFLGAESGLVSRVGFSSIWGISVLIDEMVEGDSERGFVEKSEVKFEIGREGYNRQNDERLLLNIK